MKILLRRIIGTVIILIGLVTIGFSVYAIVRENTQWWHWVWFVFLGIGIAGTGLTLIMDGVKAFKKAIGILLMSITPP